LGADEEISVQAEFPWWRFPPRLRLV